MKNDGLWTKTLLSVYRYLPRISGAIDKLIMKKGLNCTNITGQNYYCNNILTISEKIIDLSERKVTLINLKVLIEDVLTELQENDAQILIERFFDGVKARQLCEIHDISMRTTFRKIDGAVSSFGKHLVTRGYTDAKLADMLKNEGWINNVYQRFANKNEEEVALSGAFLARAVSL